MSDVNKTIQKWHASFKKGTDFDSWGQLVEAIDEYQILARQLQKEVQSTNSSDFTEEQKVIITSACSFCTGVPVTLLKLTSVFFSFLLKKTLAKIATCLEMRSASLQCTQSKEEFNLEDLKKLETIIRNVLTYNKEFPFDVQPVPLRKIFAPGEEENLELEEEEDATAGAGSTEAFPPRAPAALQGTLLPRLPSEPGMTLLTIRIEKIGLKDAGQCIDPYMTISVKGTDPTVHAFSRLAWSCFYNLHSCCFQIGHTLFSAVLPRSLSPVHENLSAFSCGCRCKWCRSEPGAGYPRGHQKGRHVHSLQCGRGGPETCGEITKR
uniref:Axin interactor, dorsalization associated n=1 Tax=Haplochromis burtoni TaxID=8153 RepID=A0A3Q2VVX0_HAPBU